MYYSSCRTAVELGQLTLFSDGAVHVCRCAIDFLECEFSQRNPQVKAVTSKGSELDTIAFRSEDPSGRKVCIHPLSLLTPAANTFNQCRLPCLRSCVAIAPEAKLSSNLFKKMFYSTTNVSLKEHYEQPFHRDVYSFAQVFRQELSLLATLSLSTHVHKWAPEDR